MAWTTGQTDFSAVLGTEPLDAMYAGLGAYEDYKSDAEGKVVLVSRGTLAFVDKIANAKLHRAKALIIFNGDAERERSRRTCPSIFGIGTSWLYWLLGEIATIVPPWICAARRAGAAKRILDPANEGVPLQFTFGTDFPETVVAGDTIADFSSRGPNSDDNYSIKPDIAAPGVNIRSTWPAYGEVDYGLSPVPSYATAYYRISGTSMATPHVAGLALLMKQEHPSWTPRDIRLH